MMQRCVTGCAVVILSAVLVSCGAPGQAKDETLVQENPPLGVLPDLPESVTAIPTSESQFPEPQPVPLPPALPVEPPPSPERVTVTESVPPPPSRPAPQPAPPPAPSPPDDDGPEIRIELPPELRGLL